ncbi:MAG: thiamine diphosphokinase [Bacteroidetes bacterium]|nr:thiamine diphosphokinase [Bacteroidota bacterium]
MNTLRFTASFDALICLNGSIPESDLFEHFAELPLIAADGAATALVANGIVPEFIVGDLDSIDAETLQRLEGLADVIVEPDQDMNDFEKTLRFAEGQLWKRLLIVGMHGGDLEHTLNNWSVMMRFGRTLSLTALDRGRYAVPLYASTAFPPVNDELISLIPQPHAHLTTEGLQWPLSNEALSLGGREGARNKAAADLVQITVHDGSLLFFCDARLPFAPEFD